MPFAVGGMFAAPSAATEASGDRASESNMSSTTAGDVPVILTSERSPCAESVVRADG